LIGRDTAFLLPLGITLAFGGDLRVVAGWSLLAFALFIYGRSPRESDARFGVADVVSMVGGIGCYVYAWVLARSVSKPAGTVMTIPATSDS
jgi:hypothetical protein